MSLSGWKWLAWTAVSLGVAAAAHGAQGRTEEGARLVEAQRLSEARPLLEQAVRDDPSDPRPAFYLGRLCLAENETDNAVHWIEKASSLDSGRAEYHLWLARAYGAKAIAASVLKQPSLASRVRKEFERASALDPDNLEARFGLVEFYLRAPGIMGGSLVKARDQAAEIGKRDPMQGRRATARIAEHEKQFDAAREELQAGVRDFPEQAEPRYWLGSFYERRKDYARAFDIYERLLMTNPEQLRACYRIGQIAAASGQRLDRGVECLKRYLGGSPGPDEPSLAAAHYRLGLVYEKKGARDLARTEYSAALDLDPLLTDARRALSSSR